MKTKFLATLLFIFYFTIGYSQEKKATFIQFELATPLKAHLNQTNNSYNTTASKNWFLPDGLSAKLGYGLHYNHWISTSIHSGIDFKGNAKLVAVPVFLNLNISPRIGESTRLSLQTGFGKTLAIGRGALSGGYKKISLGLENSDAITLFVELSEYGFELHQSGKITSFSVGIALRSF